ncbi:MAG TPA: P1 family peptidase, partial [Candidatus Saccharimonadia bacterium]|nr:P1 family peptidase [Candidatus Saccharimonadia bacterium]
MRIRAAVVVRVSPAGWCGRSSRAKEQQEVWAVEQKQWARIDERAGKRRAAPLAPLALLALLAAGMSGAAIADERRPRARGLGIPIGGEPGALDAITDVAGVEVGYATLIEGAGALKPGKGPVRTGVTRVFPRGRANLDPVFGAWHSFNGNGEMTGTAWLEEGGFLEGPVAITNTH